MEGKCLALIFLFTVLHHIPIASALGNYNISESIIQVKKSYDYCDFVLQISACMTSKPCKQGRAKQAFGIHGLWPNKLKGSKVAPITYCKTSAKFDGKEIGPLRKDLVSLWPSLYDDEYVKFWENEWLKHGTCFDGGYPEGAVVNYFGKAVSRAKDYNIWKYLTEAGIKLDVPYDVSVITNAIKKGLSVTTDVVQIQCLKLKKKWVVSQIFLCVNKKATDLIACPTGRTMCSGKPMFPSNVKVGTESSIPMLARI